MPRFDYYDTVFVPWYSEDDFPDILDLAGDESGLPGSYATWKCQFAVATEILLARGKTVHAMTVRPVEYIAWLRNTHRRNTAAARLRYLKWLAAQNGGKASLLPLPAKLLSGMAGSEWFPGL